jgi:hypothetical protein
VSGTGRASTMMTLSLGKRWLAVMVLGAKRWKEEGKLRCGENWEGVGAFILVRGCLGGQESGQDIA